MNDKSKQLVALIQMKVPAKTIETYLKEEGISLQSAIRDCITDIRDCITDLFHYADDNGLDVKTISKGALEVFKEEKKLNKSYSLSNQKDNNMNQVEIYFHDLTPVAQQRVLHAAGLKNASEGNLELSPLAILDYEKEEYTPQVNDTVDVSDPPDGNSDWSHGFRGTVIEVNTEEGYATILDGDSMYFDIDFIYLTKSEE